MSRNITVTVPDELSKKMNEMKDVNWSGVTRDCIERYIMSRTNPPLGDAIEKIRDRKDKEYEDGFNFVVNNIDKISTVALEEIAFGSEGGRNLNQLIDVLDTEVGIQILAVSDRVSGEEEVYWIKSMNFLQGMENAANNILKESEIFTHADEINKEEASS